MKRRCDIMWELSKYILIRGQGLVIFIKSKTHPQQDSLQISWWRTEKLGAVRINPRQRERNVFLCCRMESIQRPEMERHPLWRELAIRERPQWGGVRSQRWRWRSTAEELAATRDGQGEIKDTWAHLSCSSQEDASSGCYFGKRECSLIVSLENLRQ